MIALLLMASALASDPSAEEESEPNGPDTISLHAWGRAGYHIEGNADEVTHGPYLSMARLAARLDHDDRYGVFLQLSADGGVIGIADAEVHARVAPGLEVRAGRMKVPLSHDFLIPVHQMLLPTRALVNRLSPNRAMGVQTEYSHHLAGLPMSGDVQVGVYSPVAPSWEGLGGAELVLQGALHGDAGWFGHAATAVWLTDRKHEQYGEASSEWDTRFDVAGGFEDDHWTVHLEGLVARQIPEEGEAVEIDVGAVAMAGHRIELSHERHLILEPVVGLDVQTYGEESVMRGTTAVNLHEDGWHLLQTLAYEVEVSESESTLHRVFLQMQVGV